MEKIEINKFLPFGVALREVLVHPSLSGTNLKYLLRQRGIFIETNDDEDTFPLLTSTILSPLEFEFIKEKLKSKEDFSKIKTRNIEWTSNETLLKAIPDKINLKEIISDSTNRYKVVYQSNFAPIDGNPDKLRLEFKCETNNYNSSWYRVTNQFPGEIIVEKTIEDNKVFMKMVYTSPETSHASEQGIKYLEKYFKDNNYASKEKESQKILYKSFTNAERVKFLLSLAKSSDIFEFERVTDLDIGPDPSEDLPQDFKKLMSGNVKELKIKGEDLHKSFLINEKENHRYIELADFEVYYKFNYIGAEGNCKIRFGFEGYLKKRNSNIEFSSKIESLNLNENYLSLNKNNVQKYLLQEFDRLAAKKFNTVKSIQESLKYTEL